jgi:predicted protein tyrosine phosphatase
VKLLFICSANALRSPTAEAIFSRYKDIEASSAGTNHDAETPISSDLIEWADLVFAMETTHSKTLKKRFGALLSKKRVVVLGIPDRFEFMDHDLIRILKAKVEPYLPIAAR